MENFKQPYEISLWKEINKNKTVYLKYVQINAEDYRPGEYYSNISTAGEEIYALDYDTYDGNKYYYKPISDNSTSGPKATITYFDEEYMCTIGSDTMTSLSRCVNPKLVTKTNGENILTFAMYYQYQDNETGEQVSNPFVRYLVNERKIKLRVGENEEAKWYDFVVKQIQENSETKAFTYTCKDRFVNELSRTGFELEFDNELENNMGTVDYLAKEILKGSDWELETCDNLKQYIEEPLYEIKLSQKITASLMDGVGNIDVAAGKAIYAFYSQFNEQRNPLQILYTSGEFQVDDNYIINKDQHNNYIVDNFDYTQVQNASLSRYRGMRLVRQIQSKYDSAIDKFVTVYEKDGQEYYGFTETKYISPAYINNYIVNPNAFSSTTGWYTEKSNEGMKPLLELVIDPPPISEEGRFAENYTTYIKFPNIGTRLVNSSISGFRSGLKELVAGSSKYVLRIKCKSSLDGEYIMPTEAYVAEYTIEDDVYSVNNKVFDFFRSGSSEIAANLEDGFDNLGRVAHCLSSLSLTDIKDWNRRYGFFLEFNNSIPEVYIEDVQLFPYEESVEGYYTPGSELEPVIKTVYKYYLPNSGYESIEDLIPAWEGYEPNMKYVVKYNDGADAYTKVTSITGKESNRFNLLQDLNEKFECWMRIRIDRESNGKIKVINGRQQKFIKFVEKYGESNPVGFRYGVNSKSIQRTLDSNATISKLIVKNNANEFAPNGFCSIARASENLEKENALLNFEYLWRQKLLDEEEVTKDLYVSFNNGLGYYQTLRSINREQEENIEIQANLINEISKHAAAYQTYKTSYDSAVEKRLQIEEDLVRLVAPKEEDRKDEAGNLLNFYGIIEKHYETWKNESNFISFLTSWAQCKNIESQHGDLYQKAEKDLNEDENKLNEIKLSLETATARKRALNLQFYKKYSGFIQEGSWIKEDYVDDNLYYMDSLSTLRNSISPKVTYTINVLDLSRLPEYGGYKFDLGDITYIEDTEFFGWSLVDKKNPYREEIVVNEITMELDAPEKTIIKVQNYKNRFEDLFQRITAQTQQAEYHTGEYARASKIVKPDGTISLTALENTFANNEIRLQNAKDQSVVMNEFGITTTSAANPNEVVRIVSGGIFMSNDGGRTWKTGITGQGMNSSYLTAGQIDVDKVYIRSGSQPAFGWDKEGIRAYQIDDNGYDPNKYVLFNQYGLSGISRKLKVFDLNWNGLQVNRITHEKQENGDFEEVAHEAIKLGYMGKEEYVEIKSGELKEGELCYFLHADGKYYPGVYSESFASEMGTLYKRISAYGIKISDYKGNSILQTRDSDGSLWLRNKLHIGKEDSSIVQIGYLDDVRKVQVMDGENQIQKDMHAVFRAGNDAENGEGSQKFLIYEDGYFEARAGKIGEHTIGDIDSVIKGMKKLDIFSKLGYNFGMDANDNPNPAELVLTLLTTGFELFEPVTSPQLGKIDEYFEKQEKTDGTFIFIKTSDTDFVTGKVYYKQNYTIEWLGSKDYEKWVELSGPGHEIQYVLTYEDFKNKAAGSIYYIQVNCRELGQNGPIIFQDSVTIMSNNNGEDAYLVVISSSNGSFFKGQNKTTTLTANVFKGGKLDNPEGTDIYSYNWYTVNKPNVQLGDKKTLEVESKNIQGQATYVCDITIKEEEGANE